MKRLFTILFVTTMLISLSFGQMVVVGDMKIAGQAILRSSEAVHVKADIDKAKQGKIHNQGTLNIPKGITLTSAVKPLGTTGGTAGTDGMLLNDDSYEEGTLPGAGLHHLVQVEKYFSGTGWYYVSFPFDVDPDSVIGTITDKKTIIRPDTIHVHYYDRDGGDAALDGFGFKRYNSQRRADIGNPDPTGKLGLPSAWEWIDPQETLKAGLGYSVWIDFPGYYTFKAKDASNLFKVKHQSPSLEYHTGQMNKSHYGWHAIGPMQTTSFDITKVNALKFTVGETSTSVHVYDSQTGWKLVPIDPLFTGFITPVYVSPFSLILVQINDSNHTTKIEFDKVGRSLAANHLNHVSAQGSSGVTAFRLFLKEENAEDEADYLLTFTKPSFHNGFVPGEDGVKFFNNADVSFYAVVDGEPMQLNSRQSFEEGDEFPVGLTAQAAGSYTIGLKASLGYENRKIYLEDKFQHTVTDLTEEDYTFHTAAVSCEESRFVLRVAGQMNGIVTPGSNVIIYAKDNTATVKNIQAGDEVTIYTVAGQLVSRGTAAGSEASYRLPGAGVYVVKVAGSQSVATKVINK